MFSQGVVEKLKEVHGSIGSDRWADLLADKSLSRTRRMKSMILQLFASRHTLENAFQSGQEAITATFRCNNVLYSDTSASLIDGGSQVHIDRTPGLLKSDKHFEKKNKHKKKSHSSKRKRKRHISDSDDDSLIDVGAASPAPVHWQVSFGQYSGECRESDAAECLHMLAACIRMDAWWRL